MLLPDVDDAGRIVFIDYQPTHPSYQMLTLASGGTCLLEVRRDGERFEAVVTGLDMRAVDRQLQADIMGAHQWLEARAADYLRAVRRLTIARRLLDCVGEELPVIRADFEKVLLRPAPAALLVDLRGML
jgi:hypothetical protein